MWRIVGTVLGAGVGLVIGSPWWAILPVLGFLAGRYIDAQLGWVDPDDPALHDPQLTREEIDQSARATFARSLSALFVQLAQVDGEMSREEARAIRSFFEDSLGLDAAELEGVREALQAARKAQFPLDHVLSAAREELNPSERSLLLYALAQVAAADHPVRPLEKTMLEEIAQGLQLDDDVVAAMFVAAFTPSQPGGGPRSKARAKPPPQPKPQQHAEPEPEPQRPPEPEPEPQAKDPYAALGLSRGASADEVKKAYRALAQKLHPDKVAHLGPQAMELASRAFSDVGLAYEQLRAELHF